MTTKLTKKPLTSIDSDAETAVKIIGAAAEIAAKGIASAAEQAAKVVANAAAESVKIVNIKGSEDHDLLIRLEEKMAGLKMDIKDLKNGTSAKISDHESRIFQLEKSKSGQTILISIGTALVALLVSILVYHLLNT